MNENELCDDLPDEEFEDDEDYNYNDEEEYMGEDDEEEEEESEPEENDVDMRDKKHIKNAFEDDEAENEDMVEDEDDDDSIVLNESPKKLSFKKIRSCCQRHHAPPTCLKLSLFEMKWRRPPLQIELL